MATLSLRGNASLSFSQELELQRWDDHRYYHQSRINQSLHLFSAMSFMSAYVLLFIYPAVAVFVGWLLAMCSRQAGHFFFEPRHYDKVNTASHHHKEAIKVGYNLQRKRLLHGVWALIPVALYCNPSLFGLITPARNASGYLQHVALFWLVLAVAALVLRMSWLCITRNLQTGIVWATKILTDPFHDFRTYLKSPIYLARGQLLDPMEDVPTHPLMKLSSQEEQKAHGDEACGPATREKPVS